MQTLAAPLVIDPLVVNGVRMRLMDGQDLITTGQLKSAAVLLWSAFETAIRLSLTELGHQTDDPIKISETPQGLSTQAVAYGVIDPQDRSVLLRFLNFAHGNAEAVDVSLLQEVSRFTERTLDEMNSNSVTVEIASGDHQMPVAINDVIAFINTHPGRTYYTTGKSEKPFTVTVNDRSFVYTISSGNTYPQPRSDMEQLLQRFAQTHSLTPSDYHHPERPGSRFSSYFAGLMSALTSGRSTADN